MKKRTFLSNILTALLFLSLPLLTAPVKAQTDDKATEQTKRTEAEDGSDEFNPIERDDEYYELLTLFADTLDQIDRNYVKDISKRELMEAAIEGMIKKLDQYSNYIPPKEIDRFKGSVKSEFGGIGIQVSIENERLKVISPIVGSPAYRAGLIAGDVITKIEGDSTEGITLDQAVRKMKGKVGTKVTITIVHPDDPMPKQVTLERAIVRVQTVLGNRRTDDDSWDYMYDDKRKIAYVRVTSFSERTVTELRDAMKDLLSREMRGLVLDLRFNPGGLLSSAIEVCDMFIDRGRIVSTEGRNAPKRVWDATSKGTYPEFPIAVLVNRYSASASEIVSACLQDHERAVVVGERTWGKGSVQNIIDLDNGRSALKLTTAGYMRPSGKNIHRFDGATKEDEWGVKPNSEFTLRLTEREISDLVRFRRLRDIVQKRDPDQEEPKAEFEDRQLNLALEYVQSKIALGEAKAASAESSDKKTVDGKAGA